MRLLSVLYLVMFIGSQQSFCAQIDYDWAIVGAGPGGMIVAGLLLDLGTSPDRILWIDPKFDVGRLGEYYTTVPGNAKTKLYVEFIDACKTFLASGSLAIDRLRQYDQYKEYPLHVIVDPLRDITHYLRTLVDSQIGSLTALDFIDDNWRVEIGGRVIMARNVVLAHGCHPRSLNYDCKNEIPLDIALDAAELAQQVSTEDSIAVVGSAHSAILILKFLSELKVNRIINFYNKPLQYAVDMGDWVLHSSDGLKGVTAEFARHVLEKNLPAHLMRVFNSPAALQAWLPVCNKIIYAAGYERNLLPPINGSSSLVYNDTTGVIAERLFGIGLAFPERHVDPLGNIEHRIGLSSFMEYALRMVPQWASSMIHKTDLPSEQLFEIDML